MFTEFEPCQKQSLAALYPVLVFWVTLLTSGSPARSQGIVLHHFYISQDTGSPVYLSAELPGADESGLRQIPSLQSRLEQLAPSERLLIVKQPEPHDQSASLQPVGLELHSRNFLPDQASCVFSSLFPRLLPSSNIDFYGDPIEIHTLQGGINPRCSQIKTFDGNTIPFGSAAEYESCPDGLWLIEIPPLKHTGQEESDTDSFGIPGVSNPAGSRELLSGSYGNSGPGFDFKPGGGGQSSLMDINVAFSLLPTAREKRAGDQPVLVLGNREGVSIEVIDTQGHQWQRFYTMDQARELLEGVEDGENLLSRLRGGNLVVKAGVVEDLSRVCRENMERTGQALQPGSVTYEQCIPGIISCPTRKHNQKKSVPDDRKSSASVRETSKSVDHVGFHSNEFGDGNGGQDDGEKPPPARNPDSDTLEQIEDTQLLIDRLVEASEFGEVQRVREIIEKNGNHLLFGLHHHNGDSALHAAIRHKQDAVSLEIERLCDGSELEQLWNLPDRNGQTPSELKLIVNRQVLSNYFRACWPICEYCKKFAVIPYQKNCGCITCKKCINEMQVKKRCEICNEKINSWFIDKARLHSAFYSLQTLQKLFQSEKQCSSCKKIAIPPFQASCGDFFCPVCCVSFEGRTGLVCCNELCGESIEWLRFDKAQWICMFQGDFPVAELTSCQFVVGQQNEPDSIEPGTHRKNWEAVLDTYNNRGILVRMFTDRTGATVESRVEQLISGNPSSATFLLAGAAINVLSGVPGAGLLFSPDFIMLGMFKENAYTLDPFNRFFILKGYDNVKLPGSGKTFKNHLNPYSLVMKIREQALFNDWARTSPLSEFSIPKLTSGHIDIKGDFICGKMKQWDSLKGEKWKNTAPIGLNEIVVNWNNASDGILGVLIPAPVTVKKIHIVKRLISKLIELQNDESRFLLLPVVLYDSKSCRMTLLGNVESLMQINDKMERRMLHSLLVGANLGHDLLDSIHHDWQDFVEENQYLHHLAMRMLQYLGNVCMDTCSQDKIFFAKHFESLPAGVQSLVKDFNQFRKNKSNEHLICGLLNPGLFSDNLQRFIEFIPVLDSDFKKINPGKFFTAILLSVACRQLIEDFGVSFSDEETLLLPFAVVVYMGRNSSDLFQYFKKTMKNSKVSGALLSDMEQAIIDSPDTHIPDRTKERVALYHYILESSIRSSSEVKLPQYFLATNEHKKIADLKLKLSTLMELAPVIEKMKTLVLYKGNTWTLMLSELQNLFRIRVANELRKQDSSIQAWPYADLSVSVPSKMSVVDFLFALTDKAGLSPYVEALVEHYQLHGLPRYLGTIRSGYVSDRVTSSIEKELMKQPSYELLESVKGSFKVIKRNWEMPSKMPESRLSPVQGLEYAPKFSEYIVKVKGSTEFKGIRKIIPDFKTKAVDSSDIDLHLSCPVCLENILSPENTIKLECNHILHADCIDKVLQRNSLCPVCRFPLTPFITGHQPHGVMSYEEIDQPCSADQVIKITYSIPAGTFHGGCHPVDYPAEIKTAYLPCTREGKIALKMLKTAFERGLVLTVGFSLSRNRDNVVTWNDIPHKTSLHGGAENHGYPDDSYLPRLIDLLKGLGIQEENCK